MLKNYKVLKGTASALALDDDNDPHIEIRIEANGVSYRIALNVRSKESPHDLLYANIVDFKHPALTEALEALPMGLTDIRSERPELAIDYVRGGLIEREDMNVAPFQLSGPKNDLRDFIEPIVRKALPTPTCISTPSARPGGPRSTSRTNIFVSSRATAFTTST